MSTFLKRFVIVAVLSSLLSFALLLCALTPTSTIAGSKPAAAPTPMQVEIKLFTFKPGSLEVPVGTTVVWTNRDAIEHSVTNGTLEKPGGTFDSGFFTERQSFS